MDYIESHWALTACLKIFQEKGPMSFKELNDLLQEQINEHFIHFVRPSVIRVFDDGRDIGAIESVNGEGLWQLTDHGRSIIPRIEDFSNQMEQAL